MARTKTFNRNWILIIGVIVIMITVGSGIYYYHHQAHKAAAPGTCPPDMVCIPKAQAVSSHSRDRDAKVLNDPLYPPLNRTDTITHGGLETAVKQRNLYVPTREQSDEYRLVGYMVNNDTVNKDKGGNSWKLFARQKDRNTSDFYIIPSNNNYDIKIPIKDDMIVGRHKFRDIYDIPNEVTFKSPMLNETPYTFVELPKADFVTSSTYT
jgi:hypothetical protein